MTDGRLVATTPDASWLPPGSTAEVWAGRDCDVPDPCIIVRLLLTRGPGPAASEFFCVPTHRGLDLPTLPVGQDTSRLSAGQAIEALAETVLGAMRVRLRCVGYVRNVVPAPDADYPHPTPWAHVPVFAAKADLEPVVEGSWVTLDAARADLSVRHWWAIVEQHMETLLRR